MATLFLMVGLPGAGNTALAKTLAAGHPALRLSPDAWMIPLEVPDAGELTGIELRRPPPTWPTWFDWAADRWPSLADN